MLHVPARFPHGPTCPGVVIFAFAMPRYSPIRRLVSLLLAVLVLAASVGLSVQRHTCRMSGRSQVAVAVPGQLTPRGCNGQLAPGRAVIKSNCCDFSTHLHKLSVPAHELAAMVLVPGPLLAVAWPPAVIWPMTTPTRTPLAGSPRWFAADSSPPARSGRERLVFGGKLVI